MINANPLPQTVILPVGKTPPKLPPTIIYEGETGDTVEISKKLAEEIFSAIMVWRFDSAPERFKGLSTNGGDEDWVAFVPSTFPGSSDGEGIPWMWEGSAFGCCSVDHFNVNDGHVYIGSHA